MKRIAVLACLFLAGCQTASYGAKEYSGMKAVPFTLEDSGWSFRIYDKPEQNKLLISPSGADMFKISAARGLTYGLAKAGRSPFEFQTAAMLYVASTGRHCKPVATTRIFTQQYEVRYACEG